MECDYCYTTYLKIFKDFKTTRARAPHSLSTAHEVLEGCDPRNVPGTTQRLGSTRRPTATRLRRARRLVRPGATGYLMWQGTVRDVG